MTKTGKSRVTRTLLSASGKSTTIYRYEPLLAELFDLERDVDARKVNHPSIGSDGGPGSKDVADALAGAMFSCISDARSMDGTGRFVAALREQIGHGNAYTTAAAGGATVRWDRVASDVRKEITQRRM